MSRGLQCPYCRAHVEPCDDNREPDEDIERECASCEKTFIYSIEYYPIYTARQAPCKNGEPHNYKKINGFPAEYFKDRRRCSFCADEILLEPDLVGFEGLEQVNG